MNNVIISVLTSDTFYLAKSHINTIVEDFKRYSPTTNLSLLLFSGRTTHDVPEPTVTTWVFPLMMAGCRGDWNSEPHSITSVSPPAGAIFGKNYKTKHTYCTSHHRSASQSTDSCSWNSVCWLKHEHKRWMRTSWLPQLWQVHKTLSPSVRHTRASWSIFLNTNHSS